MKMYVRGRNVESAPYTLYPHPLNTSESPQFELVCLSCTTDQNEPCIIWQGASAGMGVMMGAILRHETARPDRHAQAEKR